MILNTLSRKSILAVFIAHGSVLWLNRWHQYGYSTSPINFPPFSSWWRDSMIVFLPVMLAVWIGVWFSQLIIDRSSQRMTPFTQSMLIAGILGGGTSIMIALMESSRVVWTGFGNEFVFLTNICGKLYPNGNLLLNTLQWILPDTRAVRFHILLQDWSNLALINLAITILAILILEGIAKINMQISPKMARVG